MTTVHNTAERFFASDNYSGIHPEVLAAIAEANSAHQPAYGGDTHTSRLQTVLRSHFGADAEAYPVFNGTGANVLALQSILPRWGAVICARTAHINVDENGAPERIGGLKLLSIETPDGKLTPELIDTEAWGWGDEHRAQPLAVSITQTTELGTAYTIDEIRAITEHAHRHGMRVHLDGARISNAAVSLDAELGEFTTGTGIDILSLGGTKNGVMLGEAVVVLTPGVADGMTYLRKLNMQLSSKMRFLSAQLIALYEGDLWRRNAAHSNAMATRLRTQLEERVADGRISSNPVTGLRFTQPTQSNGVFAGLPAGVASRLRAQGFHFYDWDAAAGEVRWMCSFDTTEADVDAFVGAIERELAPSE
ncbi:low specificity L-threonine aldolase [Klugiella xanthotipulae]|uniref:L-threonine aldolase n=1 Tax=Klugiella xanthotipulae TaxID=244735 RepID=A0A543I6C5_9MICO|nr:low specificity L-threonine aldolase [Klugiella xanthotipulae]TQM66162.1 L-threonine aldolase [Klugiella xanthotipulae]